MKNIVLVGFATSGKTTVGKLLANKLGCNFVDCDQLLEAQHGKSIAELFSDGEQAFRKLENQLLSTLPTTDAVVACGGGAVLNKNFELLSQGATVVWLQIGVDTCLSRLGTTKRPLHDGKDSEWLAKLWAERNALYQQFANVVVDANGTVDNVVNEILCKLK